MSTKILECKDCGVEVKCDDNAVSVICASCVTELMLTLDEPIKKKRSTTEGYPRGWRFMKEFVHTNGTVYHKGIEQPELHGTITPTTIVQKPKISKHEKKKQKEEALLQLTKLKKDLKKATKKSEIKKIESEIKKVTKLV